MLYLLDSTIFIHNAAFGEGLNFLGNLVKWIVELVPNVGLGIILFTLILKTITLPLDIYSKSAMRKNSLKMEKMRPQLEKLQKQYQNDQQMYNAKMMEMYKKNGYSLWGACLPMIVTLVLFMVVLGAFSDYSAYTNVDVYRNMTVAYNNAVTAYAPDVTQTDPVSVTYTKAENVNEDGTRLYTRIETYESEDKLIRVVLMRTANLPDGLDPNEANGMNEAADWAQIPADDPIYEVRTDAVFAAAESGEDKTIADALAWAQEDEEGKDFSRDEQAVLAMRRIGRNAAQAQYETKNSHFLWVKNIWLPDTSYQHPVQKESGMSQDLFDEITKNLEAEKSAANGYYILIVISIGSMFLSQFIMMKSQKAQNELQTADGRGQKTQKMMMIIMPIMFGIFSFFYSAAFSIYMITSSIYGIISTLLINLVIDKKFRAIEEREIQEKYNKRIPQAARKSESTRNGGKKQ